MFIVPVKFFKNFSIIHKKFYCTCSVSLKNNAPIFSFNNYLFFLKSLILILLILTYQNKYQVCGEEKLFLRVVFGSNLIKFKWEPIVMFLLLDGFYSDQNKKFTGR